MTPLTWTLAAVPLLSIVTLAVYAWQVERRDRRARVDVAIEAAMWRHPSAAGVRVAEAAGCCLLCELAGPLGHDDDMAAGRSALRLATEIGSADA